MNNFTNYESPFFQNQNNMGKNENGNNSPLENKPFTSLGTLSPVKAMVSRLQFPFITLPSSGTLSPGFTRIIHR